jgi:hypothetical protein
VPKRENGVKEILFTGKEKRDAEKKSVNETHLGFHFNYFVRSLTHRGSRAERASLCSLKYKRLLPSTFFKLNFRHFMNPFRLGLCGTLLLLLKKIIIARLMNH